MQQKSSTAVTLNHTISRGTYVYENAQYQFQVIIGTDKRFRVFFT